MPHSHKILSTIPAINRKHMMKTPALKLLTLLLLATATGLFAQTLPEIQFEKYELPNGLNVILHEDHSIPVVTVNTWYHVGSKNEKPGRTGFAHLYEHLMFEGSEHHNSDYGKEIEKIGGSDNASTSEDRTNYFETVPSNYLETALWLESDRLGFFLPTMTQEKLDLQRDVVKNERRQRIDNQPYSKAYELTLDAIYPDEHPYSWPIIGSMEDLSAASLEDVKDFFRTFYVPNNASLCISGDFDPVQTKQWVEKYFGAIPPGAPIDRIDQWVPQLDGIKRVEAEDRVSLARLHSIWPSPPQYAPGDAELDLFANVLASGKTSRLYKALVYDQQIAQDVSAYQQSNEINGTFNIDVTAKEGHSLEEIERAVDTVLRDVLEKGITPAELKQAQTGYEAGFVRSLQRGAGIADRLNNYNTYLGDPGRFQWDLDRYLKATVADVQKTARQYIDLNRRAFVNIYPMGDLAAAQTDIQRDAMPSAAAEPSFAPPAIQQATLSNGMALLLVEKHQLPLVQVNYILKSGWASDPADKPGSARLTAELLDEGTKSRSALQIAEQAKAMGASLGTSSSFDGSFVTLNVLKRTLNEGLALMTDVLFNPTFPQEELERQRQMYLGRIQQESRQPGTVAQKTFQRLLYGNSHPYSQPATGSGTEASINAITRDDLVNFYKAHYFDKHAALVVVGDMTLTEAKDQLEKAFKTWKPMDVPVVDIPPPPAAKGTRIVIVDKPNAPQSVIIAGHAGVKRSDPNYDALQVVNNAFGGQFGSRLNMNLREQKGYTYGAGSGFGARRGEGPFVMSAQVKTDVTDESVSEMIKELQLLAGTKPLTENELRESKDNLIKGYPQDFETYNALAGQLNQIALMDLPLDEWSGYVAKVSAVDNAMAARLANEYLHPADLLIVVVGDRAKIEDDLRKLKVGEVSVVGLQDLQL